MKHTSQSKFKINAFLNKPPTPSHKKIPLSKINLTIQQSPHNPEKRPHTSMANSLTPCAPNTCPTSTDQKAALIIKLTTENQHLIEENKRLAQEKDKATELLNQFVQSITKVFDNIYGTKANKPPLAINKEIMNKPPTPSNRSDHIEYLKKLRKSIANILQDSSDTKQMVQVALNEIQCIVEK